MKKQSIAQPRTTVPLNIKAGRSLKDIIPTNFHNHRIMNRLFNYESYMVKKGRDYVPSYEPFEIFPEWPPEEEVEVLNMKIFFTKISRKTIRTTF